ncbi:MAG TPA: alpha/beta hydrolase, partial [Oxalobacteraceae bacterium]|nr:alpha/beta hydrolase [Oxalobacteraceae bacterium]
MIFDPFGIGGNFLKLQQAWASHPREWQQEQQQLMTDLWTLNLQGIASIVGGRPSLCAQVAEGDDRFTDPAWKDDPFHCLLLQNYLTQTRWLERVIYDTPGLPRGERRRGAFWIRQWIDALAPTNFPLINPAVIRKALQSNGASLLKGVRNLLEDVKAGDVQMVDRTAFAVGKNLATTSGTVVFRNDKLELIQYHP